MDYSNTTFLEYQKKKKEMLNDLGRISGMCNGMNCRECPLSKYEAICDAAELLCPQEALNAVMSYKPKVDWTKVPVDAKILVRDNEEDCWCKRHFALYKYGKIYAYSHGATSFSSNDITDWKYAKLYKDDEK